MNPVSGSCLCGGMLFEITEPFRRAGDPGITPQYHSHADSVPAWDTLPADGLPRYPGAPPRAIVGP